MASPEKILIIRSDRIGDVVLTLPMAEVLKKEGDREVWFMGRGYTSALINASAFVGGFIDRDEFDRGNLDQAVKKLKKFNFDRVFVVSPDFRIALICRLANIKTRTGTGYRWYSFLFNDKIFEHRKTAERNELEYNLRMIPWHGEFSYSRDTLKNIRGFSRFKPDSSKVVTVIHPGSGGSAADLPVQKFREITELLAADGRFDLYITGSGSETAKCLEVKGGSRARVLAGELNLEELVALTKESDLFISNSTGPLHIAAAAGCFTVGFYPKVTSCSAERWGPWTKRKLIFTPEIDCTGCTLKQCARLNCMNSISGEKVVTAIKEKFREIKDWN